jgi:small GTP-binding protein
MSEKQMFQLAMREALAVIERERSNRSAEELVQAEADENKATVMSSRAANVAAEESARQHRNQEVAASISFLRQQLRETEQEAGIHDPQLDEEIVNNFASQTQRQAKKEKDEKKRVVISPRGNTIKYLARTMHVKTEKIIRAARQFLDGAAAENVTRDTSLSEELAELIVIEFKHIVVKKQQPRQVVIEKEEYSKLPPRAPVVCVMGHVDHGKTTLLDTLRHTNVVAKEAGAITQGIGAFKVEVHSDDQTFTTTFLDTPGHAAFKSMRAKGANTGLSDIIVLVVSAMDGIQPQTEEAIRLARASDIPLVVAINKMDLDGADADYVRSELKRRGVNVDGDVHAIPISAKLGSGLDELQEAIQMTADELDLRAPSTGIVQAFIVESRLDRNNGHVVNVVVRRGTLRVGDYVVSGMQYNKVRFLVDDRGERVTEAGPSIAVSIPSWKSLDGLGDELITVDTEAKAKELVAAKQQEIEMASDIADDEEVAALKAANRGREKREVSRKELVMKRRNKDKKAVELRKELIAKDKATAEAEANEMKTTLPVIVRGDVSGSIQVFLDYIKQVITITIILIIHVHEHMC